MQIKFEMMSITDLYGNEIKIVDLSLALMQADDFRHYSTTDPKQLAFFRKQQVYWEDVYQKLAELTEN